MGCMKDAIVHSAAGTKCIQVFPRYCDEGKLIKALETTLMCPLIIVKCACISITAKLKLVFELVTLDVC